MPLVGRLHFEKTACAESGGGCKLQPMGRRMVILFASLVLVSSLSSCARKPQGWLERARKAEAVARASFEKHEAERAAQAADDAADALTHLQEQAQAATPPEPEVVRCLREARSAADAAQEYAALAREEQQCRDLLEGFKVKAYRQVRATVCEYALSGLAPVAERFSQNGTNGSALEQRLASLAWTLVENVKLAPPRINGAPDWATVAADLHAWSTNPPPAVHLLLAPALAANGFGDFALSEIESLEKPALANTNALVLYHLERCGLYAIHGWNRTAARELRLAAELAPAEWHGVVGTQAFAMFSVWQAGDSLRRHDLAQAELAIARVVQAWPESPLLPLLKAERLASSAQTTEAADILESANCKDQWLAGRFTQRARELRDGKGDIAPLSSDPAFLFEFATRTWGGSLQDSAAFKQIQTWLSVAKDFGQRIIQKLPGTSSENTR